MRLSLRSSRWRSQRIDAASATGSCWVQSARSRWIAWVRSRTNRRRCSSSIPSALTSSGSCAGPSSLALGAHDVSDRDRVTGVRLAGAAPVALAVGAPRRDLEHLKPGAGERGDEAASVAAGALDADDAPAAVVIDQPVDQAR